MAESVFHAISKLQGLYLNEVNLLNVVNQQRNTLESNISIIKSVLLDAEEKQLADTSHALNNLLQKLKDVVHELDDILDDCSTEDARDEFEGDRSCSFLGFLHPQKIKFRRNINDKMTAVKETLDSIAKEKDQFSLFLAMNPAATQRSDILEQRETISDTKEDDEVFGREEDKKFIVHCLLEDASKADSLCVYPIFGIGGLGKTTLARQVYNDERVERHFEVRKWIYVSDKFDLRTLLRFITGSKDDDSLEELVEKLKGMLQTKRYLIVFDDVWEEEEEKWSRLRRLLECGSKGSAILVTTRQEKIAMMVRGPSSPQPHDLKLLSPEDCWQVIRKRAFGLSVVEETENLVGIGREIAHKCKGVPLVARTLGGLLSFSTDEKSWLEVRDNQLWKLENLGEKKDSIFGALKLSYLKLPAQVRPCFCYCAVFPKDTRISKENIIQLWVANGFISKKTSRTLELEDIGDRIVNDLYWRSLIQDITRDNDTKSIESFQLHDLVHDLAQYIMAHEILVVESGSLIHDLLPSTRHLSFDCKFELTSASQSLESCKSLQSLLFLKGCSRDPSTTWSLLQKTSLKALDWSWTNMQELPSSIGALKHLRYLNLSNSEIRRLPESIGSLWNLQTLILDHCRKLEALPISMGRLKNLGHLSASRCSCLRSMPQSMSALTSLKTFTCVVVGERKKNEFQLSALKHMSHLKGELEILQLERAKDMKDAEEANLKDKRGLRYLSLEWDRDSDFNEDLWQTDSHILEALQAPSELRHLSLIGYKGKSFSNWMMEEFASFTCIQSLALISCPNCTRLPHWWRLPLLRKLDLVGLREVRYLIDTGKDSIREECIALRSLEFITLSGLVNLEKVISREESDQEALNDNTMIITRLSKLFIVDCPKFNSFSCVDITSLRHLFFSDSETVMFSVLTPTSTSYNIPQNLNSLEELQICNCKSQSFPDQMLQGLSSLRKLCVLVCYRLKCLPESFKSLSSLEHLKIDGCSGIENIEVILQLASLQKLKLIRLSLESLDTSIPELTVLPALNVLELKELPNLASWPNWMPNLFSLRELKIDNCPRLASIPDSIQHLSNLKKLSISGCSELQQRCGQETGQDWPKIAHIPDIYLHDTWF